MVRYNNTAVQGYIVLNLYTFANDYIVIDEYILPKITIFTQVSFGRYVTKMPNFGALTNYSTLIHNGCWMNCNV
jgi:hypothetical protein